MVHATASALPPDGRLMMTASGFASRRRHTPLMGESALTPVTTPASFFRSLVRLGDERLVLGHRLSEWCGPGASLEEDGALAKVAVDLIGEASLMLIRAGEVEGRGRYED